MDRPNLLRELAELDYALEDLQVARYQMFGSSFARYAAALSSNTELGAMADSILPEVDLASWLTKGYSMRGNATLDWPTAREERISLLLSLLRNLGNDERAYHDFVIHFCYAGKRVDENNSAFVSQIVRPFHRDFTNTIQALVGTGDIQLPRRATVAQAPTTPHYVATERMDQLKAIESDRFNYSRLVRLCEELNRCWAAECVLATAMLVRSILDHVPPLFGMSNFREVAHNYAGGGKSFKEAMQHLEGTARKIADAYLHSQIRAKEVLPTANQVDVSNALDALLGEVIRIA